MEYVSYSMLDPCICASVRVSPHAVPRHRDVTRTLSLRSHVHSCMLYLASLVDIDVGARKASFWLFQRLIMNREREVPPTHNNGGFFFLLAAAAASFTRCLASL